MLTFVNKMQFFIQFSINGLFLESSFETNLKIVITGNYIQPKISLRVKIKMLHNVIYKFIFKDEKSKFYIT